MKFKILICITAITLFAALAVRVRLAAQEQNQDLPRYTVTDLGTLGGTYSLAGGLSNSGWVEGYSTLPSGNTHAVLWWNGVIINLGTLGGPNSDAGYRPSNSGDAGGGSENGVVDVYAENFCGYGTDYICLPFFWSNSLHMMIPLPTLGGNNGWAAGLNNHDMAVGVAENTTRDPTCTAPQVFSYPPVVWDRGRVHELPMPPGDTSGFAYAINDEGQATGVTSNCSFSTPGHGLLWQNGRWINLGSLGGTFTEGVDINNLGQVAGASYLSDNAPYHYHAFLWQRGRMTDLGTLPGDYGSSGDGVNNQGQVVGGSWPNQSPWPEGVVIESAVIWQNGVITDLNTLIPPNSPLYLIEACGTINDQGQIAGIALQTSTGQMHAFLLTPTKERWALSERPRVVLPDSVRKQLQQRRRFRGPIGSGVMRLK